MEPNPYKSPVEVPGVKNFDLQLAATGCSLVGVIGLVMSFFNFSSSVFHYMVSISRMGSPRTWHCLEKGVLGLWFPAIAFFLARCILRRANKRLLILGMVVYVASSPLLYFLANPDDKDRVIPILAAVASAVGMPIFCLYAWFKWPPLSTEEPSTSLRDAL